MEKTFIHPQGAVHIELRDAAGDIKEIRDITNLVVGTGRCMIASFLAGDDAFVRPNCMGLGTSTVTADLNQIALQGEIGQHVLFDDGKGVRQDNSVTYTTTFLPGVCTGAITECAIFYDPALVSGGEGSLSMLNRATFAVVNKAAADTLTINWTVTIN